MPSNFNDVQLALHSTTAEAPVLGNHEWDIHEFALTLHAVGAGCTPIALFCPFRGFKSLQLIQELLSVLD